MKAAAKPGKAGNRDRLPAVYMALTDCLTETRKAFKLEQEIDEVLEDEPHEIIRRSYDFALLMRTKQEFAAVAREMGTTTQDLCKKYQQLERGLKANEQVCLDTAY